MQYESRLRYLNKRTNAWPLQEAEKRQKIHELMLDSTIFSVITHALLTESQPVDKACRITETP
jgi:hypothetical protein